MTLDNLCWIASRKRKYKIPEAINILFRPIHVAFQICQHLSLAAVRFYIRAFHLTEWFFITFSESIISALSFYAVLLRVFLIAFLFTYPRPFRVGLFFALLIQQDGFLTSQVK